MLQGQMSQPPEKRQRQHGHRLHDRLQRDLPSVGELRGAERLILDHYFQDLYSARVCNMTPAPN